MDYEQTKWTREKLGVEELIKDISRKLNIHAQKKNIKMHVEKMEPDLNIFFDRDGFEQIMLNIAGNAVKYTPNNGNVWIKAERVGKNIAITVEDDGVGIPKEDLGRIFDRFYRVDKARTRQMGGTGLGLSIAKQVAEAHGSKIIVESEVQVGTKIKIIIPEFKSL
jgi:two-component system sensor histidine kinase VicK